MKVDRQKSIDEKMLNWVESHRIIIGILLVFSILVAAIILSIINRNPTIVERKTSDPALEEENSALRTQNDQLRKQIEEINQARVAAAAAKNLTIKNQLENQESQPDSKLININTADQKALESLPKIGPTIAQRIIDYRTTNGPFKSIEEIKKVKGIGDKTFEKIKDLITVG